MALRPNWPWPSTGPWATDWATLFHALFAYCVLL